MTDSELIATINEEAQRSYGYVTGTLGSERKDALERYLVQDYGDEVEGRSGAKSTDLRDTVEWMMPQLLRIFVGGDQVVTFDPKGPEDEKQAEQETDYVNHVLLERNPGFLIFSTWFRDALLQKTGYVRGAWTKKEDVRVETYEGKTDDELVFLAQDPSVEIVAHQEYPDPNWAPPPPEALMQMAAQAQAQGQPFEPPKQPMLHNVRVRTKAAREYVELLNIAPEHVLVSYDTPSVRLCDAKFVQIQIPRMSISEIRALGYEVSEDVNDQGDPSAQAEESARDRYSEDSVDSGTGKGPMRRVTYRESYIRCDYDGDGIAELRRVIHIGNTILRRTNGEIANEETEIIPVASLTPIIFPHRHHGVSIYDLAKDIQRIKTIVLRQYLDNLYISNNAEKAVDITRVNLDDLLVSRPGGIKRVKGPPGDAIQQLVTPQIGGAALQGIQYLDAWKENTTGIGAYYQGMNADALNKTAHGISQIMTASQGRVEAIARTFAETGVRDLMLIIHTLTCKHHTKTELVKLRNEWVPINPREWASRSDLTINVALGAGTQEMRTQQLQQLVAAQLKLLMTGITSPPKLFNSLKRLTQAMGFKNPDEFWDDPARQPPKPQQPPPQIVEKQIEVQAQEKNTMLEGRLDLAKTKMQTESAERIKLLELAAGILASTITAEHQPTNMVNDTALDTNAQAPGITLDELAAVKQQIQGLAEIIAATNLRPQ